MPLVFDDSEVFVVFSFTSFCEELSLWPKSRKLVMQILCLLCLYNHIRIPADIFLSFSVKGSFIYDMPRGRDGSLKIYSYKIYKHFNKKTKNSFNLISDNFRTKISSTWLKHRQILFLPKLQIITDLIFAELD